MTPMFLSQAAGQKSYTVNGLNQYTAVSGATYAYDSDGNLTSDGATAFGYDAENRLISGSGAKTGALKYDPLGRLYETAGAAGANLTRYFYDGDQLVAEYDGAGAMLKRYYHGPGVDEPVLQDSGSALDCSTTRVLHGDHQGSIIALADCNGNRTNINKYDDQAAGQSAPSSGSASHTRPVEITRDNQRRLQKETRLSRYHPRRRAQCPQWVESRH